MTLRMERTISITNRKMCGGLKRKDCGGLERIESLSLRQRKLREREGSRGKNAKERDEMRAPCHQHENTQFRTKIEVLFSALKLSAAGGASEMRLTSRI